MDLLDASLSFDSSHPRPERSEYIHAAVLFADVENSVMLSSALPPAEYDLLMQVFQRTMLDLAEDLQREGFPLAEVRIKGDEVALFFYDPAEVEWNRQFEQFGQQDSPERQALTRQCRQSNEKLAYSALRAAIRIKNAWLTQSFNLTRLRNRQEPVGLGIGVHTGRVFLRERPDGQRRIEGYAINLAKRVEGVARFGRYSRIMFSQDARNATCSIVVGHTQLSQRLYFHKHDREIESLKGVTETQPIYELRFFSRMAGLKPLPDIIPHYESLFFLNHRNLWAYNQLFEYYFFSARDLDRVFQLASQAQVAHPDDERVMYDLARYYLESKDLTLSREFAMRAVELNSAFDIAYELLAELSCHLGDIQGQVNYMLKAVQNSPGSPINRFNLGMALCAAGMVEEGTQHIEFAVQLDPELRCRQANHPFIQAAAIQARPAETHLLASE